MTFVMEEIRPDDLPADLVRDFQAVTFLMLDVDGVLTDGHLYFDADGRETKVFHVHDASGLIYWKRCGFHAGLISGRDSIVVRERAEELLIDEIHLGRRPKLDVLQSIVDRHGLTMQEVCYVGDDLLDVPCLETVGVPVAVPQARPEVRARCRYITKTPAGQGAVREVCDLLLKAKGLFDQILAAGGRN